MIILVGANLAIVAIVNCRLVDLVADSAVMHQVHVLNSIVQFSCMIVQYVILCTVHVILYIHVR